MDQCIERHHCSDERQVTRRATARIIGAEIVVPAYVLGQTREMVRRNQNSSASPLIKRNMHWHPDNTRVASASPVSTLVLLPCMGSPTWRC